MKVLLVWPGADFATADVAAGIRSGLLAEGHEVVDYRLTRRLVAASAAVKISQPPRTKADPIEVCLAAAEGLPYRALMTGCTWALFVNGHSLHLAGIVALRRAGIRVAGWFTEAPYETNADKELHHALLCDVAFVNEQSAVGDFQRALDAKVSDVQFVGPGGPTAFRPVSEPAGPGRIAEYLRHAYDPDIHKPATDSVAPEDRSDVLLVGTGFAERQHLLECVDWTGIDLRLGGLWPYLRAPADLAKFVKYPCLPNAETVRLYAGARIVLNPHRAHPLAESANPRVFEAAACGAFQIADRRAEIAELFGDSVPTFAPGVPWQLSGLIRRYLGDEPGRLALAAEARRRVEGQTFRARARQIVDVFVRFDREATRPTVHAAA